MGVDQREPIYFLPVPGNHDLKRPDKTGAAAAALRHYWDDESVRQAFWENPGSDYRQLITTVFKAYTEWSDRLSFLRPPGYQEGLLPGDFSATIAKGDAQIGIVGLNTTFLQLDGGNYQGRLDLEPRQLHEACGGDAPQWLRQRHACFLLTHQPPNWLYSSALDSFRGMIYTPGTLPPISMATCMNEPT